MLPLCRIFPSFINQISFAIYSMSETICVDNNTSLSSESSLIKLRNLILSFGSSPAVGSSSIKILGLFNIAVRLLEPD